MRWILKILYAAATLVLIGCGAMVIAAAGTPGISWELWGGYTIVAFLLYLITRALYWFFSRP